MPSQVTDLTTLQLAEKIARAVLKAVDSDEVFLAKHDTYFNPVWRQDWSNTPDLSNDVLEVLRETGHWFCKLTETEHRTVVEQLPLIPEADQS